MSNAHNMTAIAMNNPCSAKCIPEQILSFRKLRICHSHIGIEGVPFSEAVAHMAHLVCIRRCCLQVSRRV